MLSLRKLLYGSASNLLRVGLSVLTAALLPPLLTRHLSQAEYTAWVLILQMSAYVALLDGGLQTVTAKLVAEHHARDDFDGGTRMLSSSVSLLTFASAIGIAAVAVITYFVPQLFHDMPVALISQVRWSLLLVGCSAAIALPFNPFAAVFNGMQEYGFPSFLVLVSKLLSLVLLGSMVLAGKGLIAMAAVMAAINLATALAQWIGWRRYARHRIGWLPFQLDRAMTGVLLRSGGILAVWSLGGLLVSGLDVVIVGRYDFANTGFYSIGVTATNFMLVCVSSLFTPLLPAVSAMQNSSTPEQIGDLTIRASRFCVILLCILALPLTVFAFPLLSLWVGKTYANHSTMFLRLLILGNLIRLAGLPYSTVVIATARQHLATVAIVAEALVNVTISLWLVQRIGATGVAYGTVAGSVFSIGLHLLVSMRATRDAIALSPGRFARESLLRPFCCVLPAVFLIPSLIAHRNSAAPVGLALACFAAVLCLFGLVGLTRSDRQDLRRRLRRSRQVSPA